jgi:tripartite-type tricarboxylate transporter receptor subunit TctC
MNKLRLAILALLATPLVTFAQNYPSKPIRLVVPYAAGGAMDTVARPTAQKLSEIIGQPVIVDNRPGANANLGADLVAKSAPDGYTLLLVNVAHYVGSYFSKTIPFDPVKDFTPVANLGATPNILAVHPSVPVNSISELISYGKKNPNKLFYGTTGVGSMHHLGGVQLAHMAGINLEHVPYKGGSPTINDAVGGQIPIVILTASTILPYARVGKLRPLGVIEGRKIRLAPEIQSINETVPGYAVPDTWFGIVGPAGLPRPIVERLNVAFRQAITAPDVKQRLEGNGFEITGTTTADEFSAFIKNDIQLVTKIVTAAGIKPE